MWNTCFLLHHLVLVTQKTKHVFCGSKDHDGPFTAVLPAECHLSLSVADRGKEVSAEAGSVVPDTMTTDDLCVLPCI